MSVYPSNRFRKSGLNGLFSSLILQVKISRNSNHSNNAQYDDNSNYFKKSEAGFIKMFFLQRDSHQWYS